MANPKNKHLAGDFWGGMAAMLVALPAAIAFGVTIFSALGGTYAAYGALAGILGATALGLVASLLGGTNRLITAPCAPAAAVLSAFAIEQIQRGTPAEAILLLLTVLGLSAGLIQLIFGLVGLGRLIKYMPYPVVSGYLSAVGFIIIGSQLPKLLGTPNGSSLWRALTTPTLWQWQGIVVGAVTALIMVFAPRFTKLVPAAILALLGGVLTYFGLATFDGKLLMLAGNTLVVGSLDGGGGGSFVEGFTGRWLGMSQLSLAQVGNMIMPALTLAILLSIDTLKTCVVLDALTRSRHNSNRELVGQGLGNMASSLIGGLPGAGTMGATLVNMSSGAQTKRSGLIEGILALVAFLLLGSLIAWVPVAALAAILTVIGVRMIDRSCLHFLKSRATVLDFAVIAAVVVVALSFSLIAASATGIGLAILLFIREQIGGSVVRRKSYGNQTFSKCVRRKTEMEILEQRGDAAVIFELQGSLFFGTTAQLYNALEPELKARKYVILDMRRVQSVDVTATHMLEQVKDMLAEHQGFLIFSRLPNMLPSGQDMQQYFDIVGLVHSQSQVKVFGDLDEAIEWVEDRVIAEAMPQREDESLLGLHEIDLFNGRKEETMVALEACMEKRRVKQGEAIFTSGDDGDELFLIRRGAVRIVLPLNDRQSIHLSTFGRGNFFGEMAFLDGAARSADAIAHNDVELFVLPRKNFDKLATEHKMVALNLLEGIASVLATRLRYANAHMRSLET
ncbi:MAG: cyclic nucleotide-binding domain-containing protein [Burkholderiales bacterium]|nr:cyclic nucleotide-binding domain-containing protein [Burkholderiales bacterium]